MFLDDDNGGRLGLNAQLMYLYILLAITQTELS